MTKYRYTIRHLAPVAFTVGIPDVEQAEGLFLERVGENGAHLFYDGRIYETGMSGIRPLNGLDDIIDPPNEETDADHA